MGSEIFGDGGCECVARVVVVEGRSEGLDGYGGGIAVRGVGGGGVSHDEIR